MKQNKKAPKKDKLKTKSKDKAPARGELSEDQLEHVAGGALSAVLSIDDKHKDDLTTGGTLVNTTTLQYKW
jgi:hypothetical protein